MSEAKTPPSTAPPAAPSGGGGGIKALMPLILTVVLMPVLAYTMTVFVLVPKLQKATVQARVEGDRGSGDAGEDASAESHGKGEEHAKPEAKEDAHGKKPEEHGKAEGGGGHGGKAGGRPTAQFGKVLVNVAGSLGSRYLLTNFTLVGSSSDLKEKVDSMKDQLMDLAIGTLRTKSIQDLEKPGASNLIRTELISAFNGVLGNGAVKEIYFTEFAIQ